MHFLRQDTGLGPSNRGQGPSGAVNQDKSLAMGIVPDELRESLQVVVAALMEAIQKSGFDQVIRFATKRFPKLTEAQIVGCLADACEQLLRKVEPALARNKIS